MCIVPVNLLGRDLLSKLPGLLWFASNEYTSFLTYLNLVFYVPYNLSLTEKRKISNKGFLIKWVAQKYVGYF